MITDVADAEVVMVNVFTGCAGSGASGDKKTANLTEGVSK